MVKKVTAFQSTDGKTFATYDEASRHDARMELVALGIFNEGTINAILSNVVGVANALKDYASEIRAKAKEQDANAING